MIAIFHQIIEMFEDFFMEIGLAIDREVAKIAQSLFFLKRNNRK